MNLMQILNRYARSPREALPVGLVGAGEFGATFIAQSRRMSGLACVAVCDRDTGRARAAALAAGIPETQVRVCRDRTEAEAAIARGELAIVDDAATLASLPLAAVLEATGDPEGAAATALASIEAGRHVVMATKEAEIVVGPELARRAAERGVVHSPVDGDQPSLLIGLVDWARAMGLPVVSAGKASESDFVWDPERRTISAWGETIEAEHYADAFRLIASAEGADAATMAQQMQSQLQARARLPFGLTTVPDLCEMGIVANQTGLMPDCPGLHAPVARTTELPWLFRPAADGGLLGGAGRVDMFNCLRRPDELSFAGGVFVVIEAPDPATGRLFAAKGIPTCQVGRYVLLHNPVHLLGAEATASMLSAVQLGLSTGGLTVQQRVDLVATATRDLEPGERLEMGIRHVVNGLGYRLQAAQALGDDRPVPYYLATGARVVRPVRQGAVLCGADLEIPSGSVLHRLRIAQDSKRL